MDRPSKLAEDTAEAILSLLDDVAEGLQPYAVAGAIQAALDAHAAEVRREHQAALDELLVKFTHAMNASTRERDTLLADLEAAQKALTRVRARLHFVGMPQEPMKHGRPDWEDEIAMIEAALTRTQ